MHVTNEQFSDKFSNGWEKKSKLSIYCDFLHFDLVGALTSVQYNVMAAGYCRVCSCYLVNTFKPEFTIVIFIHHKPRIAVAILDL